MTRCPNCRSRLPIPREFDPESSVRCPRCRKDVELAKLIAQGVLAAPRSVESSGEGDEFAYELISNESDPASSSEKQSAVVRRRYYSRTRLPKKGLPTKRRRKRKPKTEFTRGDIVKVILGGLLAFPVAQLLLWWVFGKDPFGLGPKVAYAIPFVVPYDLRGQGELIFEEKEEPIRNPNSNLLIGKPFHFERDPAKTSNTSGLLPRNLPRRNPTNRRNQAPAPTPPPATVPAPTLNGQTPK